MCLIVHDFKVLIAEFIDGLDLALHHKARRGIGLTRQLLVILLFP